MPDSGLPSIAMRMLANTSMRACVYVCVSVFDSVHLRRYGESRSPDVYVVTPLFMLAVKLVFDSALGPGEWHTEYHMGILPDTTGIGRRRCALPNTLAIVSRHAQTHTGRSIPHPSSTLHSPKKCRRWPQRRFREFRELHTRRAMCCGLPLMRSWHDAKVAGSATSIPAAPSTAIRPRFVSPSKLAPFFQPARLYLEARSAPLFMDNYHSSTAHKVR